jgi:hypothetical protein
MFKRTQKSLGRSFYPEARDPFCEKLSLCCRPIWLPVSAHNGNDAIYVRASDQTHVLIAILCD